MADQTVVSQPTRIPHRFLRRPGVSSAFQRYALVLAWGVEIAIFAFIHGGQYLSINHFTTLLSTQSVLLVLAIAAIPPLLAGDLDLSIAANLALSGAVFATLNVTFGWPLLPAIVAALCVGIAVGVINSVLVVGMGIDSIVITLGMGTLLTGLALSMASTPILGVAPELTRFMRFPIFGLQVAFYLAVAIALVMWLVLNQTAAGRRLVFVGGNRTAAALSGIRVGRIRVGALVSAAFLSSVGGIMLTGLFASADANSAPQLLLPALAAVFLGATAFTPGRFNVPGTFVAVYFLVFGVSGLEMSGMSGWVSEAFYGASLIFAVVLAKIGGQFTRAKYRKSPNAS